MIIIAGNVKIAIPAKESPGEISYKNPPASVNIAVLKLIAKAEYTPCALEFCSFGSEFVI